MEDVELTDLTKIQTTLIGPELGRQQKKSHINCPDGNGSLDNLSKTKCKGKKLADFETRNEQKDKRVYMVRCVWWWRLEVTYFSSLSIKLKETIRSSSFVIKVEYLVKDDENDEDYNSNNTSESKTFESPIDSQLL